MIILLVEKISDEQIMSKKRRSEREKRKKMRRTYTLIENLT